MKLSKRLEACVNYTDGFLNLADIGTDHAQLPIAAIERGYVSKAQAIDNKHGPYVIAFSNVKKHDMTDKIDVVLGDGINKITTDTDVVVIAGMGGELIAKILLKDSTKNVKRFILQANNHASKIREILPQLHYKIVDELVLEDQNKIYEVIVIEPGETLLTDEEIEYGPLNLIYKPHFFIKKINQEIIQLDYILTQINDPKKIKIVTTKLSRLKEFLQ